MTDIRYLSRERQGVLLPELRAREFPCSDRGAVFSCCALVKSSPGDVLGLDLTNPHRGGSK
jgi:hypothetical protein